jgi:hypothetical protein
VSSVCATTAITIRSRSPARPPAFSPRVYSFIQSSKHTHIPKSTVSGQKYSQRDLVAPPTRLAGGGVLSQRPKLGEVPQAALGTGKEKGLHLSLCH